MAAGTLFAAKIKVRTNNSCLSPTGITLWPFSSLNRYSDPLGSPEACVRQVVLFLGPHSIPYPCSTAAHCCLAPELPIRPSAHNRGQTVLWEAQHAHSWLFNTSHLNSIINICFVPMVTRSKCHSTHCFLLSSCCCRSDQNNCAAVQVMIS